MGRLPDILIILVVFLMFFGWQKAPEVGAALGRAIREFKKNLRETEEEISASPQQEILASNSADLKKDQDSLPASSTQQAIKKPIESSPK